LLATVTTVIIPFFRIFTVYCSGRVAVVAKLGLLVIVFKINSSCILSIELGELYVTGPAKIGHVITNYTVT